MAHTPQPQDTYMLWKPPATKGNQAGIWQRITLGDQFDEGGTSIIFTDGRATPATLYKMFHIDLFGPANLSDIFWKLKRLAQASALLNTQISCAVLPEGLIFKSQQKEPLPHTLLGCSMKRVPNAATVLSIGQHPDELSRLGIIPGATIDTLRTVAFNIITGLEAMHASGLCLGDPNGGNILADKHTLAAYFIDHDSFVFNLVVRKSGDKHPTRTMPSGSTPGYRSPSVIRQASNGGRITTYTTVDDAYVLAIHLFRLLVAGFHPFNLALGHGEVAEVQMLNGAFPYAANMHMADCLAKQIYTQLPGSVRAAFHEAFVRQQPPSPAQWRKIFAQQWSYLAAASPRGVVPLRPAAYGAGQAAVRP